MRVGDRIEIAHRQERQVLAVEGEDRLGVGEPPVGDVEHLAVGDPRQPQPAERIGGHGDGVVGRVRPRQPGRIRRPGESGHDPVVRHGDLSHLAGADVDDPQPPVLRRDRDRPAVRCRRQLGNAAHLADRDPPRSGGRIGWVGRTCRVAGADLQGVAALSVGRPDDLPAGP